jgi:hypothetical protein
MRLALLFAVLMLACSHAADWDGPPPPGIQLIPVSVSLVEDMPTAVLTLVNGTREPFHYVGYSPSLPIPYGATEIKRAFRWKRVASAYCGTGLAEMSLPAGASVTVTIPLAVRLEHDQAAHVRVVIGDARGRFAVRSSEILVSEYLAQDSSRRSH